MNAIQTLLTDSLDIWSAAETGKKSGRGRASGNAGSVYGIRKLRELILDLAVRGKLVEQDASDEPASALLKRIRAEKAKLIADGKIRKGQPLPPITEQEKTFDLPHGWDWGRLGLIGDWGAGATPLRSVSSYYGGETPWFKSGELTADFIDFSEETITDLALKECSLRLNQPGDVLIAMYGATIGKTAILKVSGTTNQAVCACTPNTGIFNRYLLVLLKAMKSNFIGQGAGGAQPNISREKIIATIVAIPSTEEQHRIVAKVDELMALCDQLETRHSNAADAHEKLVSHLLATLAQSQNAEDFAACWQRIAAHFDTLFATEASIDALKQILLQLAVMGKLVPQDPKDEPASALLKRIQTEKTKLVAEGKIRKDKPLAAIVEHEIPYEVPLSWMWIRVSEITELTTSGSRDWAKYLSNDGAKFITMGNLARGSYELRLDNIRYVNPPESGEGSRTKLAANDLLISITGDVGNLGRIPEGFGDAYINQHTCLLRFLPQCRNRYFPEVMRSPMAALQFNAPQRGIKNSFRLGDLNEMVIPLPPAAEQHRIVAKVDELMTLCEKLKSRITDASRLQQKLANVMVKQAVAN